MPKIMLSRQKTRRKQVKTKNEYMKLKESYDTETSAFSIRTENSKVCIFDGTGCSVYVEVTETNNKDDR